MVPPEEAGNLLAPFLASPDSSGIITDFDGTLAPIVDDPTTSRPLPGVVELLHALAERYGRVAVVSGRPVAFLSEHLELRRGSPLLVSGLYGMETAEGGSVRVRPEAETWRSVVAEVADRAEAEAPPQVVVERKGLSVTMHYRTAPQCEAWAREFADDQARRTGLVAHPARRSEELRPPLAIDKGTVVTGLVDGLSAACFLGDDRGDLPAFSALDDLATEHGASVVKVAVQSPELPDAMLAAAHLSVDGPEGTLAFLRLLLP